MFAIRFPSRRANQGWLELPRPNGQFLFLQPIGKQLRKLGTNLGAAAKSAACRYQDMRLEDFEAVRPFDNPAPIPQMAAIKNSSEPSQDVHENRRGRALDVINPTEDLPPGLYWRGSEGIKEIPPMAEVIGETEADENPVSEIGVDPMPGNPPIIDSKESPDTDNTDSGAQFSSDRMENLPPTSVRTMVESLLTTAPEVGDTTDYLSDALADIFVKKEVADPRVQALLRGLERLDCRRLADELREFADSIGANSVGK